MCAAVRLAPTSGTSWANAYTSLQDARNAAVSGDQIWVAVGTYKPTTDTDRTVSFELKSGVEIYGGFAGSETQLSERNWTANVTILSGDLSGNDSGFYQQRREQLSRSCGCERCDTGWLHDFGR